MQKVVIATIIGLVLAITAFSSYAYYNPSSDSSLAGSNLETLVDDGIEGASPGDTVVTEFELQNSQSSGESSQATTSGSSGSSQTTTTHSNDKTLSHLSAGETATVEFHDHSLGIHRLDISVNSVADNVKISVHSHGTLPDKTKTGKVYTYPHVKAENLDESQLENVKYHFQVPKEWVTANGLTKDQIAVYKFDDATGSWNKQKVSYDSEDGDDYFYHININSFGEFAISQN